MYLTEKTLINYLNIIFPHINDWKNNKSFSKTYKSRPDYKSDQLKLIVEFDGYQHYTSAKRILADIKNDNFYIQNGFNVIRIPYFVQMSSIVIKNLFNVDIDIKSDDENVYVEITKRDGTKKDAVVSGGGTGGTTDYKALINKPKINNVVLDENKTLDDLGIQPKGNYLEKENDPTVPLHVKNIKETDINSWDNKSEFSGSYNDLNNVPTNIAKTNQNNNFSTSQTINGTLTINGNIVQNGESYETHAEQIYTEKDEIITRDGATGGLSKNQLTGIRAKKYDGTNDGQLGFDASGTARVGDENDTQPLLTRDETENLIDGQVLVWNGTQLKAVGSSDYVKNTDIASQTKLGLIKAWTSTNEDGEIGLNISTEV